jgi:hypothetical protein
MDAVEGLLFIKPSLPAVAVFVHSDRLSDFCD